MSKMTPSTIQSTNAFCDLRATRFLPVAGTANVGVGRLSGQRSTAAA
jgi:hypothetical protein